MSALPASLRRLTPERLRDDVRLRALAVGSGLIPPRTMHSSEDARVLLGAARDAKRVVEIGVYEGSSALALCQTLGPDAELHLVDPFGAHPDALPSGWGATEWATRRVVARALRARGPDAPTRSLARRPLPRAGRTLGGRGGRGLHRRRSLRGRLRARLVRVASIRRARRPCGVPRRARRPARRPRAAGADGRRRAPLPLGSRRRRAGRSRRRQTARWSCGGWPEAQAHSTVSVAFMPFASCPGSEQNSV